MMRCNGPLGSGDDDDTEVEVGTYTKLGMYRFSISFILSIEVLKVFICWISAYGGQNWVIEIYIFEIHWFGCGGHLCCEYFVIAL